MTVGLCQRRLAMRQVPGTEKPDLLGCPEAEQSWSDVKRYVQDAIGLDLNKSAYQLGALLEFDPQKEKFIGNERANELLTRPYREPFVVTEEV